MELSPNHFATLRKTGENKSRINTTNRAYTMIRGPVGADLTPQEGRPK